MRALGQSSRAFNRIAVGQRIMPISGVRAFLLVDTIARLLRSVSRDEQRELYSPKSKAAYCENDPIICAPGRARSRPTSQ